MGFCSLVSPPFYPNYKISILLVSAGEQQSLVIREQNNGCAFFPLGADCLFFVSSSILWYLDHSLSTVVWSALEILSVYSMLELTLPQKTKPLEVLDVTVFFIFLWVFTSSAFENEWAEHINYVVWVCLITFINIPESYIAMQLSEIRGPIRADVRAVTKSTNFKGTGEDAR